MGSLQPYWERWSPLLIILGSLCLPLGLILADVRYYFPGIVLITLGSWRFFPAFPQRGYVIWCFTAAICLALYPDLSDDFHRYLWEGHVQNQGYSPYQNSPQDLYDQLDHPSEQLINHDHLPAIYPPLAQYLFRLSDFVAPTIWGWKVILLLWCLLWIIPLRHSSPWFVLLVPAVSLEGWWNGHLDLAGLLPCLLLLEASKQNRSRLAGFTMGVLIALKTMPVLWFPFFFLHFKQRERWWFTLWTGLVVITCYAPFLSQGIDLFFSFITFSKTWHFNNLFFVILAELTSNTTARTLLSAIFGLGYLAILFSKTSLSQKCLTTWICLIICSPTFFPWYLVWLAPFLAKSQWKTFNLAYAAAFLSYWVLVEFRSSGIWQESLLWLIPEWTLLLLCFYAMLTSPAKSPNTPYDPKDATP